MSHTPSDQVSRDRVIRERKRNVVVIAGAGTGKTKTIIDRAVELLAPTDPDAQPIRIDRTAALTFTRRAAGELRFRLRERLLRDLEREALADPRRARLLRDALGSVDAAFIGTIHGFADRLLRLRPVEAELSPSYTLVEDNTDLVRETLLRLQRGIELGTLREDLGRFAANVPRELIDEAGETMQAAALAGVQMQRAHSPWGPLPSVEDSLGRMIETRDVDVQRPPVPDPALDRAIEAAGQFRDMVAKCRGGSAGVRRLRRVARALERLPQAGAPPSMIRVVNDALRGRPLYKGRDFNDDSMAWGAYKTIHADYPRSAWVLDKLKGPHRWLATRLVRLAPVACAMYERVKAEREVVDYLDLLIKLRDMLRDNVDAREFYRDRFDHVFVDEFQDTDPLQCEIVFYLCGSKREPVHELDGDDRALRATTWEKLPIEAGKLTIVGDPKQSIYRFRRADIAMYSRAVDKLAAGGALRERLTVNFRSHPSLIEFFNEQLAPLLGRSEGESFDPATGRAAYDDLAPASPGEARRSVHVLPYSDTGGQGLFAGRGREVEGQMLARYIRWLLDSGFTVRDLDSGEERPVRQGDIAVLACVTTHVPLLLRELDGFNVAYSARGGSLFVGHPIIRQFLLALRAIADRHDGVAESALLQPPFFALDWADLVAAQIYKKGSGDERRARVDAARGIVRRLRGNRHLQSPGATARDLIEQTALGRAMTTYPNGAQTLAALYEVAHELDRRASLDGRDFDAVTELARAWAETPTFLEAPEPVGDGAIRVMTVHGAKGLEFPVTILWDGFQILGERGAGTPPWQVERDGRSWALNLGPVSVEYPQAGLVDREKSFGVEERKRLYYVAATRARDLLVVPAPVVKSRWEYATAKLLARVDAARTELFEAYQPGNPPAWARGGAVGTPALLADPTLDEAQREREKAFAEAHAEAARPRSTPQAVTTAARHVEIAEDEEQVRVRRDKAKEGRFGPQFGIAVHRAIELVQSTQLTEAEALAVALGEGEISENVDALGEDVGRALAALSRAGMDAGEFVMEYPIARCDDRGRLLSGFIDLLHVDAERVSVIDFKTDAPRDGAVAETYPAYARQLSLYGEMLREAGVVGTRMLRLGLLFTATGELRWFE